MAAVYPSAIPALTNPAAADSMQTVPHDQQHGKANDEIVAIATELGTLPKGSAASVKERLDTLDTTVSAKVPATRTVNSKALSADVVLTTADVADSADKRYCTDAQKVVIGNTSGTNTGDQVIATELSFTNASLSTGVLTVTHNKGLSAGYTAIVQVVNNSGAVVFPDAINTFATNSFKVDLTSYGTLTGTWYVTYIVKS